MQSLSPIVLVGLFIAIAIATLIAFEAGLRLGRWRSRKPNPEALLPARVLVTSNARDALVHPRLHVRAGLVSLRQQN